MAGTTQQLWLLSFWIAAASSSTAFQQPAAALPMQRPVPLSLSSSIKSFYEAPTTWEGRRVIPTTEARGTAIPDPSQIEFRVVPSPSMQQSQQRTSDREEVDGVPSQTKLALQQKIGQHRSYPMATMMQGSAPYICQHIGEVAVVHLPASTILAKGNAVLQDLALCWLLGMKLVLIADSYIDASSATMKQQQQHAGFLRTEVERKLHRCLRHDMHMEAGNVVSGSHFYTTTTSHTGFASLDVQADAIRHHLQDGDVILLSTIGMRRYGDGDLVTVDGLQLAAATAVELKAHKLVYMATAASSDEEQSLYNTVLAVRGASAPMQEVPLSLACAVAETNGVVVGDHGVTVNNDSGNELLGHIGWSSWALKNGVSRAHSVNRYDGALLEELFTSKNGANTCFYHDAELSWAEVGNSNINTDPPHGRMY